MRLEEVWMESVTLDTAAVTSGEAGDRGGKNSAPIVTGVSRSSPAIASILSIVSASLRLLLELSWSLSSASAPAASRLLIVFSTVWEMTSVSAMAMRSGAVLGSGRGEGEAAGLGVEMLDICFLSCLNLWYLVSRMGRRVEMLTASLSIVSRLSMMIILTRWRTQTADTPSQDLEAGNLQVVLETVEDMHC